MISTDSISSWIAEEDERCSNILPMGKVANTVDDVAKGVNKTQSWKAPGPDGIHNFCLERFTSVHRLLSMKYSQFLNYPEIIPPFFSEGIKHLLPKDRNTHDPSK